jgi:hypothetical protein
MAEFCKPNMLLEALVTAGIADRLTRRVVIDIQEEHVPVIYIERYGDRQLINVIQTLNGIEIAREEKRS